MRSKINYELLLLQIFPIPVWDKGKRDNGTLSREDFRFEPDRDLYICPRGNALKPPARCMTAGPCSTGRANTTAIPAL